MIVVSVGYVVVSIVGYISFDSAERDVSFTDTVHVVSTLVLQLLDRTWSRSWNSPSEMSSSAHTISLKIRNRSLNDERNTIIVYDVTDIERSFSKGDDIDRLCLQSVVRRPRRRCAGDGFHARTTMLCAYFLSVRLRVVLMRRIFSRMRHVAPDFSS